MITRQLNPQAITLEDAQGEIKKTIKDAYLAGKSRRETERLVALIIVASVRIGSADGFTLSIVALWNTLQLFSA